MEHYGAYKMRTEVESAVGFLSNILKMRQLNAPKIETFRQTLQLLLCTHYQDHWFPEKPFKGSGYRCIRINHKMDPLIAKAGDLCGLSDTALFEMLPNELTLWIDPKEVSYRIGEDGSVGVLYGDELDGTSSSDEADSVNNNQYVHSDSSSSSPAVSPCPTDFVQLQNCKDQYRSYYMPSGASAENMNYFTAAFAAS